MTENLPTKDEIIGASLKNLKKLIIQYATQGKNVLLLGPRGSGKELFAKLYQEGTERKKIAPINCSGISDDALISELFGHIQGSFTDAKKDRKGIILEYGKGGVIFLDEIGDASHSFQAALLRVLETGDFKPFGSDEFKTDLDPDDMRIIAATTKIENVRPELKDRFSTLYIPELPVRIIKGDLPELIKEFCQDTKVVYISQQALKTLEEHLWPGNVRELKTVLDDAIILCKMRNSKIIQIDDLPTLLKDRYPKSHIDNSEKLKINELPSNPEIPPPHFFYKLVEKIREEQSIPMKNEEAEMLRRMLDSIGSSISEGFRGVQKAIHEFSQSEIKIHPTLRIDFENTIPDEYTELFYEHHVKKGRGGTKLAEHFDGKINRKTASSHLRKAKQRLNKAQGEESD